MNPCTNLEYISPHTNHPHYYTIPYNNSFIISSDKKHHYSSSVVFNNLNKYKIQDIGVLRKEMFMSPFSTPFTPMSPQFETRAGLHSKVWWKHFQKIIAIIRFFILNDLRASQVANCEHNKCIFCCHQEINQGKIKYKHSGIPHQTYAQSGFCMLNAVY